MRPYVDVHVHIGMTVDRDPQVGQNTPKCLARMADTNVLSAIIGPTAVGSPITRGLLDIMDQNDAISRACRSFPDRFPIGLALIELRLERAGVTELERAMSEGGLKGVMYHPTAGGIKGELVPFVEIASMYKGLCLLHGRPADIATYAKQFAQATFLVSAVHDDVAEYCRDLDNVWFGVVQLPKGPGAEWDFAKLVDQLGNERIVFGSDTPYFDYRIIQAQIEAAPVDEETKDRIAYRNAINLVKRFTAEWELPAQPVVAPQNYAPEQLWAARGERLL